MKPEPDIDVEKYWIEASSPFKVKPDPLADINIQDKLPAASELSTDVPVDGDVAGQTYVVLAVAAESKPV